MILTARARLSGVLGWPIAHSLSPRLHGYWLEQYAIDGAYVPLGVHPQRFHHCARAMVDLGFVGANVTIPHKESALALADDATRTARRIGAANTLVFRDGRIFADNTDVFGFLENLREQAPQWTATAGAAAVIGAGGAARAILVALLDSGVPEIRVTNRTVQRAEVLAEEFGERIRVVAWGDWDSLLTRATAVVNTTALGMQGHPCLDITLDALPPGSVVSDIVYMPLETALLSDARDRGHTIVDGLGMLMHQARPGFEAWFGRRPEVSAPLRRFLLDH